MLPAVVLLAAASADTLTFQAGTGDFGTTLDTTLAARASIDPTAPWLFADTSDGDSGGGEVRALIAFPDIIGPGEGQIRRGSEIHSATLTLHVDNPGGELGVHQVLEPWTLAQVSWSDRTASDRWAAEGIDPPSSAEKALTLLENTTVGTMDLSVRIALREWVDDPSLNHGLVLIPQSSDGVDIFSSEAEDPSLRPLLTVDYTPSEGDTGEPEETGESAPLEDSGTEDRDTEDSGWTVGLGASPTADKKAAGCGCLSAGGATSLWAAVLGLAVGLCRRQRSPTT